MFFSATLEQFSYEAVATLSSQCIDFGIEPPKKKPSGFPPGFSSR